MIRYILTGLAASATLYAAPPAIAQSGHAGHDTHRHGAAPQAGTATLAEPGQGAFAAIGEIVARLRADPATDWSRVDIAALHKHLLEMDRLMTETAVRESHVQGGVEMTIPLPERAGSAALAMVPAHAPVLAAETGWQSAVVDAGDALVWTVTGPDAAQIRALGFFGLMATGDHHRAHHWALATGAPMH